MEVSSSGIRVPRQSPKGLGSTAKEQVPPLEQIQPALLEKRPFAIRSKPYTGRKARYASNRSAGMLCSSVPFQVYGRGNALIPSRPCALAPSESCQPFWNIERTSRSTERTPYGVNDGVTTRAASSPRPGQIPSDDRLWTALFSVVASAFRWLASAACTRPLSQSHRKGPAHGYGSAS
jgi:hypothetical protein